MTKARHLALVVAARVHRQHLMKPDAVPAIRAIVDRLENRVGFADPRADDDIGSRLDVVVDVGRVSLHHPVTAPDARSSSIASSE